MAANLASARRLCRLDGGGAALLELPERSIVLLPKAEDADAQLPGVAPGLHWLGLMLPTPPCTTCSSTPPPGSRRAWPGWGPPQDLVLVMTSANPGGEPLVSGNAEALERLAGIADAWLCHDRDIVVRSDDSVLRWDGSMPSSSAGAGARRRGPSSWRRTAPPCWPSAPT
ncbi:MAG: Sua5/YciO/YrdC/YwlC family protein [Polyangiaceae bacterium]